jgi:hypothetical protein
MHLNYLVRDGVLVGVRWLGGYGGANIDDDALANCAIGRHLPVVNRVVIELNLYPCSTLLKRFQ